MKFCQHLCPGDPLIEPGTGATPIAVDVDVEGVADVPCGGVVDSYRLLRRGNRPPHPVQ